MCGHDPILSVTRRNSHRMGIYIDGIWEPFTRHFFINIPCIVSNCSSTLINHFRNRRSFGSIWICLFFLTSCYGFIYKNLKEKKVTHLMHVSLTRNRFSLNQNFFILLHKSLFFTHFPSYMKNMFSLRSSSYDLRGNCILSLSKTKTMVLTYGFNSFSYFSPKQWNALPEFFRTSFFADLKTKLQDVTFT